MTEFLSENWYVLVYAGVSLILAIVSLFISGNKKVDIRSKLEAWINDALPLFITYAEEKYEDGSLKKSAVLQNILGGCSKMLGRKLSEVEESYVRNFASTRLEAILTTPQKKEVEEK